MTKRIRMSVTLKTALTAAPMVASMTALKMALVMLVCLIVSLPASPAMAAKPPPVPDLSDAGNPETPPTQEELDRAKLVNITQPPPVPPSVQYENEYYHKYRNSISLRAGSQWTLNDIQNPGLVLGIQYAYRLKDSRAVEAGADLNPEGSGTLHFSRREMIGNEAFRWFYKYGLGVRVIGSDQLVTFIRLRNWQIRGGGGFEWTTSNATSFRLDVEPVLSTENIKMIFSLGVAFAF